MNPSRTPLVALATPCSPLPFSYGYFVTVPDLMTRLYHTSRRVNTIHERSPSIAARAPPLVIGRLIRPAF